MAGGIILGGAVILDEIFDDDDWDGWDSDDDIDWDGGDITIDRGDVDIDIDRGDINIGDGDRASIGDGDRPQIGDGDRISIGDSDRTQVDRGNLANIGDRAGDRPARWDFAGEPDIDLECSQPRCRAPEDRGAQDPPEPAPRTWERRDRPPLERRRLARAP